MKVFQVYYTCFNCGYEFSEQYEKGISIHEGASIDVLKDAGLVYSYENIVKRLECPNCEYQFRIGVISRKPL